MQYHHRAAWIEIGLLCYMVGVVALALITRTWLGVFIGAGMIVLVGPAVIDGVKAVRRGERWEGREFVFGPRFSKARQIAAGAVLLLGVMIWRILTVGWLLPVTITGTLLAASLVWLAVVLRREGWSGGKVGPE
jgi:hypothetical protein